MKWGPEQDPTHIHPPLDSPQVEGISSGGRRPLDQEPCENEKEAHIMTNASMSFAAIRGTGVGRYICASGLPPRPGITRTGIATSNVATPARPC